MWLVDAWKNKNHSSYTLSQIQSSELMGNISEPLRFMSGLWYYPGAVTRAGGFSRWTHPQPLTFRFNPQHSGEM